MPEGKLIISIKIHDNWIEIDKKGISTVYIMAEFLGKLRLFSKRDMEGEEWKVQ